MDDLSPWGKIEYHEQLGVGGNARRIRFNGKKEYGGRSGGGGAAIGGLGGAPLQARVCAKGGGSRAREGRHHLLLNFVIGGSEVTCR